MANALADHPLISKAFSDGKVSYTKVRAMTREATPDNEADLVALEIPIEEGQLIEQALDKAVQSITLTERAPDDETSWSALRADAMVVLAKSYLSFSAVDGGASVSLCDCSASSAECESSVSAETQLRSTPAADHYQVMVHVDESALTCGKGQPVSRARVHPLAAVRPF